MGYDLLTAKVELCFRMPLYRWRMTVTKAHLSATRQGQRHLEDKVFELEDALERARRGRAHALQQAEQAEHTKQARQFGKSVEMASENEHLSRELVDMREKLGAARILLQSQQQVIEEKGRTSQKIPLMLLRQHASQLGLNALRALVRWHSRSRISAQTSLKIASSLANATFGAAPSPAGANTEEVLEEAPQGKGGKKGGKAGKGPPAGGPKLSPESRQKLTAQAAGPVASGPGGMSFSPADLLSVKLRKTADSSAAPKGKGKGKGK
eukprot:TRINITY_DN30533_c0_g1_i1.p1 TRINITY_DN30533_c0_g1~~TRINITY_DN30533_c0_g1_i1.p1  ORF type:complete len:267 (-),score=52.89 TRINITY_DN30533_c0_g1_i1:104-904(-)